MKCPVCQTNVSTSARSVPQLRRFFGMLRAMAFHWPDDHLFQPLNSDHLRAWALCKIGHADVSIIDVPDRAETLVSCIQAALRAAGSYAFVQPNGDHVKIFKPKSISFPKLSSNEFSALSERITELFRVETNLNPDEVLEQYERAA